jgi:(p)ppGpp synthase/HD superfamily hydrolase
MEDAKSHYERLGAQDVYAHACDVLRAAVRGKLLLPSSNGADPFSLRLAELILYHSFENDTYLPSPALTSGFGRVFPVHTALKRLDSMEGDRSEDYVRLLRDRSIDPADLIVALYARIADMMTVHEKTTRQAASIRMPGVFAMHESWDQVKTAWADPMLRVYCPIADWGAQTVAYRDMRDNAIRYLYPEEFGKTVAEMQKWMPALARTNDILQTTLALMSRRLNLRVLVANHYSEVSQAFPELDDRTVAVSLKPFKGIGGLLNKSIKKGVPIEKVHDWTGFTVITDTEERMYDVVTFLHDAGIRAAASEAGITDLCILPPVDYARNPKPVTHYRSVHIDTVSRDPRMVPLEAIVRTKRMHEEADEGTAGHDIYKLSPLRNGERKSFLQRLGEITSSF